MESLLRDEERKQLLNDGDKIRIEPAVSDKMNASVGYIDDVYDASHVPLQVIQETVPLDNGPEVPTPSEPALQYT